MARTTSFSLLGAVFYLAAACSAAFGVESVTDAQAAHFLEMAGRAEIDAANLALGQTSNSSIRAFANETLKNHEVLRQKNLPLLGKSDLTPEDNDYSRSLSGGASVRWRELSKLSGSTFDKAYAKNELFYDLLVIGVIETKLIPSAKSGDLKNALESGLALFKDRQKNARLLMLTLK